MHGGDDDPVIAPTVQGQESQVQQVSSGEILRQNPRQPVAGQAHTSGAATSPPALLTAPQAAGVLQVSERRFHQLRLSEDWLPRPIALGPRLLRWSRQELEAAVAAAPRAETVAEPPTLAEGRRRRIEAMRRGVA